jgi:hypothetical protein
LLRANVDDSHGRIVCLLGRILLGCWKFGFHIKLQFQRDCAAAQLERDESLFGLFRSLFEEQDELLH